MLGDLRAHLGRVAVDGLLAAENRVKLALGLLDLLNGLGDDVAGRQRVGPAERAVAHQVCLIRRNGQ